ncbi:MAG: hypothetical protein Q8N58_02065 [bacterium]|nr:hypothetical protein [bacterium]
MRIKEIKIDKTKILKLLKRFPLLIANHAFSACLILFLSALLIGSVVFYKYFILAQKIDPSDLNDSYLLNEEGYQEIKNTWQKQETIFEQSDSKEYPNPFIESLPFPKQ